MCVLCVVSSIILAKHSALEEFGGLQPHVKQISLVNRIKYIIYPMEVNVEDTNTAMDTWPCVG